MIQNVSSVFWGGRQYKSVVLTEQSGEIIFPPSLFLARQSIDGKSEHTITNYAYRLNTFFKILKSSGDIDWRKLNNNLMAIYLNRYLYSGLGLQKSSLSGHISVLSSFYDWAWKYGYLDSPKNFSYNIYESGVPKKIQNNKVVSKVYVNQYISDINFRKLLGEVKTDNPFLIERNELILYLGYRMGLRSMEIVDPRNFRLNEMDTLLAEDTLGNYIEIIGKGEKLRRVPIPPEIKDRISNFFFGRLRKIKTDHLICGVNGQPLNRKRPNSIFRKAAIQTLNPYWDSRVFHSLRHTYATNLVAWCYKNQLDPWLLVPEYMGHEDHSTTLGYVFFEAVLSQRHSLLKKLHVEDNLIRNINKTR